MTQAQLAARLGVSASYIALIEGDRRPLPAGLLIQLATQFDIDVRQFGGGDWTRLIADLGEAFGDPLFADRVIEPADVADLAGAHPDVARGVVDLYHAYLAARGSAQALAERILDPQELGAGIDPIRLSSEQVSDMIEAHANHFPELEDAADQVRRDAGLEDEELFARLASYLETRHGVQVRIAQVSAMGGLLRRFDRERHELFLSEVLRRGSRNFQLAYQVGLLAASDVIDRLAREPTLTTDASRALGRVALANYFASAVLMPYEEFFEAVSDVRYDIDLLGHRFRASYEQVCHRLTTLRRRGREGIRFHMIRVDIAGNISKKFSATGVRFPRFSGLCPLWNVHGAFLSPGFIRVQISALPDGMTFFSIARTVRKHRGGYQSRNNLTAIGLGCRVEDAAAMVYADGVDLENPSAAVPVGVTCRLCDRRDCEARAFPPLQEGLSIDEDVRGASFYAPVARPS